MTSPIETLIRNTVTRGVVKIAAFNRNRLRAPETQHPYLSGIHTPMTEELTLETLSVTGTIPPALDGRYLRIGPNPVSPPNPAAYHWFTGDGMVHGIRLSEGKALWYRNRWIRSHAVSAALGEAPAPGPRHGNFDNANTNVIDIGQKIFAIVEAGGFPVELDGDLNTVAHNPFEGSLTGSFSAHPHFDPATGEMHAICYHGLDQSVIRHVVVDAGGTVIREEPIAVAHGPSIHDCMITKNYVIILDLPVTFSMKTLLAGHPFPYAWNPDHPPRIGLLPRHGKGSDTIWCAVDPMYIFHPCNAFEDENGQIVLDAVVHETMFASSRQGPDSQRVSFERLILDPRDRSFERQMIDTAPQEFPRFDERRIGQNYRYAYCMALPDGGASEFIGATAIYKHDLETGAREIHEFGAQRYPGEFVFVPRGPDAGEDDGWLIGLVVDMNDQHSELVILDAQRFAAPPQAVIHIPHRIPPGFHGNWVRAR